MYCENCGTLLSNDAVACNVCGAIANKTNVVEPEATDYAPAGAPVYEQPVYNAEPGYTPQEPMYASQEPVYTNSVPGYNTYASTGTYNPGYNSDYNGGYYQDPIYNIPYNTPDAALIESLASGALTMGILSLCLCFVPVLGIIFAVKGKNRASKYATMTPVHSGKATTGRILSIFGLVFSIILTPIMTIIFMVGMVA